MAQEPLKLVWEARHLEFDLNQRYKIGRGTQNDIQIPDQLVSSNHAVVQGGYLTDNGSTNGTFINGEPIEKNVKRPLKAGDVIMFGDTSIKVERGTPYDSSTTSARVGPSGAGAAASSLPTEDDSDSDEDDSVPSGNAVIANKKPDDNPIAWHPSVSPAAKTNGATVHDTQAASAFSMIKGPQDFRIQNQQRIANATKLQQERKQKEKERKLEAQVEDLKYQLLYGLEQNEKFEKIASQQLVEVKKEIETVRSTLHKSNEELNATRKQAQALDELTKSYDTLWTHSHHINDRLDRLLSLCERVSDAIEHEHNPKSSSRDSDDRTHMVKSLRLLAMSQNKLTEKIDGSMLRIKLLLTVCLIVLFATVFVTISHTPGLRFPFSLS